MTIVNTNQPWVNADGLAVKFSALEQEQGKGGEVCYDHDPKVTTFDIDYLFFTTGITTAPDSATEVKIVDYNLWLPNGAIVERIEIAVGTAWTSVGDAFTMDLGLVRRTDFTTIIDHDGLFAAVPESGVLDIPGNLVRINRNHEATYDGALLDDVGGVSPTYDAVFCMSWNGAAPTAGTAKIRIFWR